MRCGENRGRAIYAGFEAVVEGRPVRPRLVIRDCERQEWRTYRPARQRAPAPPAGAFLTV